MCSKDRFIRSQIIPEIYRCAMVPTLVENSKSFCVFVCLLAFFVNRGCAKHKNISESFHISDCSIRVS